MKVAVPVTGADIAYLQNIYSRYGSQVGHAPVRHF